MREWEEARGRGENKRRRKSERVEMRERSVWEWGRVGGRRSKYHKTRRRECLTEMVGNIRNNCVKDEKGNSEGQG